MRKTDENHVASAYNITDYLDACGITSERRSIYRDIAEINKAIIMLEQGCDIETAEEILALGADGVMLSDGPGDPEENKEIIEEIKKL